MEPAPPPITVTVAGQTAAPAELLAGGPPPPRRPPVPGPQRALALAVCAVLGAGLLVAHDQRTAPPPPVALPPGVGVAGVSATAERAPGGTDAVERLRLTVLLQAATGRGDSGGSPDAGPLRLLDVMARGFQVRLPGSLPRRIGEGERQSAGGVLRVPLAAEVVVTDCSVETGAPRSLRLQLRRGDGPVGTVLVSSTPQVVRALDRLVQRTCRRPRA